MEAKTKKIFFSGLVELGLGAVLLAMGFTQVVDIYTYLGAIMTLSGSIQTVCCGVKGIMEHIDYKKRFGNWEKEHKMHDRSQQNQHENTTLKQSQFVSENVETQTQTTQYSESQEQQIQQNAEQSEIQL